MARIFEAFRFEIDEISVDDWRAKRGIKPYGPPDALEQVMFFLATEEFREPYRVDVFRNISQWRVFVDIYFDFKTEKERFKFRLAGKGEELQNNILQRIISNEHLHPLRVLSSRGA